MYVIIARTYIENISYINIILKYVQQNVKISMKSGKYPRPDTFFLRNRVIKVYIYRPCNKLLSYVDSLHNIKSTDLLQIITWMHD